MTIMSAFFRYFIGGTHLCHVLGIKYCFGFDILVGMGLVSGLPLSFPHFNSSSTYGPTYGFCHYQYVISFKNIYCIYSWMCQVLVVLVVSALLLQHTGLVPLRPLWGLSSRSRIKSTSPTQPRQILSH